ncbi:16S rRNA (uracil(1498)-N(3))-methyltransferase [Kytococcus sedentarius]|uniref:16S rRNA (uracil(1498)-N(3))-methyltransferase n=1 Tax=Kytococcus sedentarius TaxID=1276 RepID=UPI0035BC3A6F
MTLPLFVADGPLAPVGGTQLLTGEEGRHAAAVQRLSVGEEVLVADGAGSGVRGEVVATAKNRLELHVLEGLTEPAPRPRLELVQALAKSGRAEQALETSVEIGVDHVVPWEAERSISRWSGPKATKGRAKWAGVVRAATKQSRRLHEATVGELVSSTQLAHRIEEGAREGELTLVLHEVATDRLLPVLGGLVGDDPVPPLVRVVIGPEGGISPRELEQFTEAGGHPVLLGPHVLRTSSAGPVALSLVAGALRW